MDMRKRIFISMVFLLMAGICSYTYGQILTGTIRGTVKDETGAVLPGVTVELISPALIGGPKVAVSNERGFFRFPDLPPGVYELTYSLEGFQILKREGIVVRVDTTITEEVILKVAPVAETVTVTAETPVVDVTKSGISTSWSTDMMENLPRLRYTFFDLVQATPGVWSYYGGTSDSSRSVAYGSSSESNSYLFEGVDVTAPEYGAAWPWINPDVIQEIQVVGIGTKAEYGNFMGTTINIVTKSGGNNFRGNANALYQQDSLTGDNSQDFLKTLLDEGYITQDLAFPYHRQLFYDVSFQIGGPIIKDKVWFYFGSWRQIDQATLAGTDPQYYTTWENDQLFIKSTVQVNPNNKIIGFFNYEWFKLPDAYTPDYGSLDTVVTENGGLPTASLALTSVLSDKTFTEIKFSYTGGHDSEVSITDYWGPTYVDWNTGVVSGGPWWPWFYDTSRHQLNGSISHFAEDFIAGDHDFKFGVQYNRGFSWGMGGYAAGVVYATYTYYYYGIPYEYRYKYEQFPYQYGAIGHNLGIFMDDTWTVNDRLTLNVGLRFDYNKSYIQDLALVDANWNETGEMVPGMPDLVLWKTIAPRLGFTYKLTEDGKTLLRANVGRYYDAMIYGNWDCPGPAATTWYMYGWTGTDWELWTDWAPELMTVDPNLKNPYSDQISIGFDREILPNFGLSFTYLEKWTHDMIGYKPAVGTWDDYYQPIPETDPYTGNPIQVYNLIDEYPEIIISNPDWLYMRYRMLSIIVNKRMADNWQLSASFTYTKAWGVNSRGAGDTMFGENILWGTSYGKDPNHFLNVEGAMVGDRPYSFKVVGSYFFPYDISASFHWEIQSGSCYARRARIYGLNQGTVTMQMEPRQSNRTPTISMLDFRFEKNFKFKDRYQLKALFEVFNIFNKSTPDWYITFDLVPGTQFLPSGIFPPRRAQLGLRFIF